MNIVSFYRMFFTLCLSTKGQLYWSVKMWIKCTSCIIDQRRTKCDRHIWCQLSGKPMLWQGRTLLLVVIVAYKTYRGAYENFLFRKDGAHTQFSKTSQLASIFLHNESLPRNTISQTLVRVRLLGGHVKIQIGLPWGFYFSSSVGTLRIYISTKFFVLLMWLVQAPQVEKHYLRRRSCFSKTSPFMRPCQGWAKVFFPMVILLSGSSTDIRHIACIFTY